MMTNEHKQQIHQWISETLVKLGHENLLNKIDVEFSTRYTRKMGTAFVSYTRNKMEVSFSQPLWPLATEKQRFETVVHEVCHIVNIVNGDHRISGPHGYGWKRLMVKCGVKPERCHNVEIPQELRNNVTRYMAKCSCRTIEISAHRRTKMLNGINYLCRLCAKRIALI